MKKLLCAALCSLLILAAGVPALADASVQYMDYHNLPDSALYVDSVSGLPVYSASMLSNYRASYYGHVSADGVGGITAAEAAQVRVISKSATLWAEPRTGSKRLATVKHGETLEGVLDANGYGPTLTDGFYPVTYKGQFGYINEDYVVLAPLEIVLMESNVPAYCAPTTDAKKVGSLAKLTRYTVLGFYNDYYIISLRQAAAFVPMSVRHYDTGFERLFYAGLSRNGTASKKTQLRTGPGDGYAQIEEVRAGYAFTAAACIDGWYLIHYNADGDSVYAYIKASDVVFQ